MRVAPNPDLGQVNERGIAAVTVDGSTQSFAVATHTRQLS